MKPWPVLAGLLFFGFSVYAAHNGDSAPKQQDPAVRAGADRANEPVQASPSDEQQKLHGTKIPGVRSSGVQGRSPAKQAWEWSDEERIRVRFDPASVHERNAANADKVAANVAKGMTQPSVHSQAQPSEHFRPSQQHVIDGSRDPELFLPDELLDFLLDGLHSNAAFRTNARRALAKSIGEMGYTEDDFWNKLQRLSAPYLALKSRPSNGNIQWFKTPDGKNASSPIDVDRCVARHNLLQAARTTFGAEKFQRFLYAAVAPEVQRGDSTQEPDPGQELLFVARGCH